MSDYWAAVKPDLEAPLNRAHVKQREQSGRKLSYVEGWHAIAEANRIFGFGDWTRETVEIKCVAERERKIGGAQRDGWGVSYIAKVRVVVAGVIREGVGAGHGIDVDLGLAHESAIKEAETDAMKRALMTFGNPFGLALYDKEQSNVATVAQIDESAIACQRAVIAKFIAAPTVEAIDAEWKASVPLMKSVGIDKNHELYPAIIQSFKDCKTSLQERQQRMAAE
jgi:DNA repair and recombination protein RAD52